MKNVSRLSKSDIVDSVAASTGLSKRKTTGIVNQIFAQVRDTLEIGGSAYIPEIGTFKVKSRPARDSFSPSKGVKVKVPARNIIHYKVAAALKAKVK